MPPDATSTCVYCTERPAVAGTSYCSTCTYKAAREADEGICKLAKFLEFDPHAAFYAYLREHDAA